MTEISQMTTDKQIAPNRANARRSTGPKTEVGKEIAKLNAVKHGGLSPLPVLPEVETPDAWQDHLDGTLASLRPFGHLETVLAERIALILWRMNRVARFEREVTAVGQERVIEDVAEKRRLDYRATGPDHPDQVRTQLRDARRSLGVIAAMYRRPDGDRMTGDEAEIVLSAVADQTEEVAPETFSMPEVVPDEIPWSQFDGWTVGRVRQGIAAMAEAEGDDEVTADGLLFAALEHYRVETIKLKAAADSVARDLDHMRRERLLASPPQTDRIARYEAHLSRQLAQALHELQGLQAARAGEPVTPPVVVDVTVSDGE
jgi:hypothetical protein